MVDSKWAVFNGAGACVAEELSKQEAKDYIGEDRFRRGWTAVSCTIVTKESEWPKALSYSEWHDHYYTQTLMDQVADLSQKLAAYTQKHTSQQRSDA